MRRRGGPVILVAALAVGTLIPLSAAGARAGPRVPATSIAVKPKSGPPGGSFHVAGIGFLDPSQGCDIKVTFRTNEGSWPLATIPAQSRFARLVQVPSGAEFGQATVQVYQLVPAGSCTSTTLNRSVPFTVT